MRLVHIKGHRRQLPEALARLRLAQMDEETFQRLKRDWSDSYTGSGNRHKTPILEGGAKFTPLNLNHTETQMLESRKYTRSQIAGLSGFRLT